jgi:hypothetical protein
MAKFTLWSDTKECVLFMHVIYKLSRYQYAMHFKLSKQLDGKQTARGCTMFLTAHSRYCLYTNYFLRTAQFYTNIAQDTISVFYLLMNM